MTSKSASSKKKTIVWALDPFELDTRPTDIAVKTLRRWMQEQGAVIQPVYVASTLDIGSSVEEMKEALDDYVDLLGVSFAQPGQVLVDPTISRAKTLEKLLAYADGLDAEAIALSSHGRSGLSRLALGSFAENLMLHSGLPILFLTNKIGAAGLVGGKNIIFATDFSQNSKIAFQKFLQRTDLLGAKVILFHSIQYPLPYAQGGVAFIPDNFFAQEEKTARKEGAQWVEEAKAAGVSAELIIRDGGVGANAAEAIKKIATELNAHLVVMASASGAIERVLFGSAAYDVFREGFCPVLIYGPSALRAPVKSKKRELSESKTGS